MFLFDDEGGQQAQHVRASITHDESGVGQLCDKRSDWAREADADHEAFAPQLDNAGMLGCEQLKPIAQVAGDKADMGEEAGPQDLAHGREGHGGAKRIATEGAAMRPD